MTEPASGPEPVAPPAAEGHAGSQRVSDPDSEVEIRTAWWQRLLAEGRRSSWEITRFAVLRLLALVYLVAFAVLAAQMQPLIGSRGLLPAAAWLPRVRVCRPPGNSLSSFHSPVNQRSRGMPVSFSSGSRCSSRRATFVTSTSTPYWQHESKQYVHCMQFMK